MYALYDVKSLGTPRFGPLRSDAPSRTTIKRGSVISSGYI